MFCVLFQMNLLLKEYLTSGDVLEAERCLRDLEVPHFHHELVYEVKQGKVGRTIHNKFCSNVKSMSVFFLHYKILYFFNFNNSNSRLLCFINTAICWRDVVLASSVLFLHLSFNHFRFTGCCDGAGVQRRHCKPRYH